MCYSCINCLIVIIKAERILLKFYALHSHFVLCHTSHDLLIVYVSKRVCEISDTMHRTANLMHTLSHVVM